jgi:hypothetical protein
VSCAFAARSLFNVARASVPSAASRCAASSRHCNASRRGACVDFQRRSSTRHAGHAHTRGCAGPCSRHCSQGLTSAQPPTHYGRVLLRASSLPSAASVVGVSLDVRP